LSKRRQRRVKNKTARRADLGWVGLFLALVTSFAIGSFLGDARGVPYDLLGGFFWAGMLLALFVLVLLYYAQFVLPLGEGDSWFEGIDMIWRHYLLRGSLFLKELGTPAEEEKQEEGALPVSFKKLKAGFVTSHNALAVARGNSYARAAGPGFVMLAKKEHIKETIDLRPQVRSQIIKANTRDGIPFETTVSVSFRVRQQNSGQGNDQRPYPYDREAIFHVSYLDSMSEDNKPQPWVEQVSPRAAALLLDKLALHKLDQLYNSEQNGRLLLQGIAEEIEQSLANWLSARGIELLGVGIGHLRPPVQIKEQRVRSWQAGWERRIKVQEGIGRAEALRRVKQTRARAQIEIINNILESIDAMRLAEDTNLSEIIMLRMIEVLEETAQDAMVRKLFPEQVISKLVMDASSEMRQLLKGPETATEEAES
jgi:regulator of protease activity HflC (stomatin/prohibitin superfamily)